MYSYAVIAAFTPFHVEYPSIKLQVVTQGHQHMLIAMILGFILIMKSKLSSVTIEKFLGWFGVVNVLCTLAFRFVPWTYLSDRGYVDRSMLGSVFVPNTAMNAILNVALIPFMMRLKASTDFWWALIVVVLVLTSGSSVAYLSLFAMLAVYLGYLFEETGKRAGAIPIVIAGGIFGLVLGAKIDGGFYNDGGRFAGYKMYFQDSNLRDWLLGHGPASFQEWGALIQYAYDSKASEYGFQLWMHSDPLQFIWEYGALFLPLLFVSVWGVFKKADSSVLLSLVALLAGSLLYYPFHQAPHLITIFLLLKIVMNDHLEKENKPLY